MINKPHYSFSVPRPLPDRVEIEWLIQNSSRSPIPKRIHWIEIINSCAMHVYSLTEGCGYADSVLMPIDDLHYIQVIKVADGDHRSIFQAAIETIPGIREINSYPPARYGGSDKRFCFAESSTHPRAIASIEITDEMNLRLRSPH